MKIHSCEGLGTAEGQLVALLIQTIGAVLLLYRVVGQMDSLRSLLQRERIAGQSEVALPEKVGSQVMSDQHPQAYVEFATLDQQRLLDVFLNDVDISSDLIWVVVALVRGAD